MKKVSSFTESTFHELSPNLIYSGKLWERCDFYHFIPGGLALYAKCNDTLVYRVGYLFYFTRILFILFIGGCVDFIFSVPGVAGRYWRGGLRLLNFKNMSFDRCLVSRERSTQRNSVV